MNRNATSITGLLTITSCVPLKPDTTDVGRLKPDPTGRGQYSPAEKVNSELNRFEDKLAWVAYFNAGIRVVDLSDPYNLKEGGFGTGLFVLKYTGKKPATATK